MSGFKDMVARDNFGVFLNCDEFAEKRTVKYDGATYEDIALHKRIPFCASGTSCASPVNAGV